MDHIFLGFILGVQSVLIGAVAWKLYSAAPAAAPTYAVPRRDTVDANDPTFPMNSGMTATMPVPVSYEDDYEPPPPDAPAFKDGQIVDPAEALAHIERLADNYRAQK